MNKLVKCGLLEIDVENKLVYARYRITLTKRFGRKTGKLKLHNVLLLSDTIGTYPNVKDFYSDEKLAGYLNDGWQIAYCTLA